MPIVQLERITHDYGRFRALNEISLTLTAGPIGLIGQNGAGKSTLLKILMGLIQPTHGTGSVLGFDIQRETAQLRRSIGFMPEADAFLPGVPGVDLASLAGELSGMPRLQARRRAHEVLSHLGLEEARYRPCEQYSVGMKQRLKLACALVHDPQLLLLDEPTAGLDPDGRDAMLRLLQALARRHGRSLIMSTHLLGDIERVCEQVVIIDRGQLLGLGRIQELSQARRGRYRLQWSGDGRVFFERLTAAGVVVHAERRSDQAMVDLPSGWSTDRLFAESLESGLVLRGIWPEEEDLQQVYHRLISQPEPTTPVGRS